MNAWEQAVAAGDVVADDGLSDMLGASASATFSLCRRWRYQLWRVWDPDRPLLGFLMLNPSTADAFKLDPTVTRCVGYARRDGFGGLCVTNVFAWRSTDPKVLYGLDDPVGVLNDAAILDAAGRCSVTVAAWGVHAELGGRGRQVLSLLDGAGVDLRSLRVTKDGSPGHPLYLRGDAPMLPYPPAQDVAARGVE